MFLTTTTTKITEAIFKHSNAEHWTFHFWVIKLGVAFQTLSVLAQPFPGTIRMFSSVCSLSVEMIPTEDQQWDLLFYLIPFKHSRIINPQVWTSVLFGAGAEQCMAFRATKIVQTPVSQNGDSSTRRSRTWSHNGEIPKYHWMNTMESLPRRYQYFLSELHHLQSLQGLGLHGLLKASNITTVLDSFHSSWSLPFSLSQTIVPALRRYTWGRDEKSGKKQN